MLEHPNQPGYEPCRCRNLSPVVAKASRRMVWKDPHRLRAFSGMAEDRILDVHGRKIQAGTPAVFDLTRHQGVHGT